MRLSGFGRAGRLPVVAAVAFLLLAGGAGAATTRVGDGRVGTQAPHRGSVLACAAPGKAIAQASVPWIRAGRYLPARKPVVDGAARWPFASFTLRASGRTFALEGNGMPVGTATGTFPPAAGDDAARYAAGTAALTPHRFTGELTARPRQELRPRCIASRHPVGVALNGVPILPAFGPGARDLAAREVQDRCGGRTDGAGLYYYRAALPCLLRGASARRPSPLVGYARDGFPIFGPRGEHGRLLTDADLDACHGQTSEVTFRGRRRRIYHYNLTAEFPYVLGCFRGVPAKTWSLIRLPSPAGPAALEIAAQPGLTPAFDPAVSDYVVRCGSGPVSFSVSAPVGTQVSVDGQPGRSGTFSAQVGLASGQATTLTTSTSAGAASYHVRCLPPDFPAWSVERSGTPQAQWYLLTPNISFSVAAAPYVAFFDSHGTPVWWMRPQAGPIDAKLLPGGDILWGESSGTSFGNVPTNVYEERRLDGTLVRTWSTVGSPTDQHDFQLLANGDALMLSYRTRDGVDLRPFGGPDNATVLDGEIQEIAPSGALVWSWNTKDHIALSETGRWWSNVLATSPQRPDGSREYDIVHLNSLEPDGDGIIFSARHLDAVYRIDRASGNVVWKLGGTARPESLTVLGDAHGGSTTLAGQHDARRLPDGTLTLYDNGTFRSAPRALRFAVDPAAGTATLLEEITDPAIIGSICCGSARRLPGGDWVVNWANNPVMSEVAPSGAHVLTLSFANGVFTYRAVPLAPGALDASALRAGMDAMHPR